MTTVRDVIEAAHRKLGVHDHSETLDASRADAGLFAFNSMLHSWKASGLNFEHSDSVLTDSFPLPPEFKEGVIYLLAEKLAPDYMTPFMEGTREYFQDLQARYFDMDTFKLSLPEGLKDFPSRQDHNFAVASSS